MHILFLYLFWERSSSTKVSCVQGKRLFLIQEHTTHVQLTIIAFSKIVHSTKQLNTPLLPSLCNGLCSIMDIQHMSYGEKMYFLWLNKILTLVAFVQFMALGFLHHVQDDAFMTA